MRKHLVSLRPLSLSVVWLLLSVSAPFATAETPTGALAGVVRTSDGLALPGVAVTLDGPAGERRVTTGPDGTFRASGLAAGEYAASVDAPGLELREPSTARVGAGESRLDLVLAPAPVSERVVVSATRGEATLSSLGVSADVLDRQRIDDRAAPSLLPLLQEVPGVATARTGQTGLQASVFVRGGESRYACVLVDGVAVNQPGGSFDFGTVLPFELERVEVVRGAASSLYGNDALAGVVSLQTRRARPGESPSLRAEGEGGSFDWQRGLVATSGARGALRLERGRAAAHHRQRGAEQPLRADGGRALRRGEDRLAHGGARGRPLRRQHDGDAGADRLRASRSRRVLRARGPRRVRLGAPRRGSPLAAAERRLRAHRPALAEPRGLRLLRPRVGRPGGRLPALRLPERGRIPEPDVAARRRLPGRRLARDTAPPDRRRRGRARDRRARQPRRGAARRRSARTSAPTCRTACCSARART